MSYVTSIERLGIEKGIQQGMQQGRQQGMARVLLRLLLRKFGELPPALRFKLDEASDEQLASWAEAVLTAPSMDAIFDDTGH